MVQARRVPIPAQVIVYAILSIGALFMHFPLLNMVGESCAGPG